MERKRTQALLGSNLLAILSMDTLCKGRLIGLPFPYTGILVWLKKTQRRIHRESDEEPSRRCPKKPIKTTFYQ